MKSNATPRTRLGDRPRRARPLALAILLTRVVGWLGIALGLTVVLVDRASVVERWLREDLARRLAPIGSSADFDALHIDWLGPGVTLEGFRVTKDDVTHLVTDRLYVAIELSPRRGLALSRLDLEGGLLRIRDPLVDDVRALLELEPGTGDESRPEEVRLPPVQVRGFRVDIDGPRGETHTIGSIDFSLESKPKRPARISGRLVLPAKSGAERSPEVYLHGVANLSGQLELFASAKDLAIEDWLVPALAPLDRLLDMQPQGRIQLQSRARLDLLGESLPDLQVRVLLEQGRLEPSALGTPLENIDLRLSAHFAPQAGEAYSSPAAWSGGGRFTVQWASQALEGGLRVGSSSRPGSLFESWMRAPRLDVQTPEIVALKPRSPLVRNLYEALHPSGEVEATVALACREDWTLGDPIEPKLEYVVRVVPASRLRAAWHGWPLPQRADVIPLGFPMPAFSDEGAVYFARNARYPRRGLLDVDFSATHPTGPVRVTYQSWSNPIDMPPFAPGYGKPEADLFVIVPRITLDEKMKECMYGLRQVTELETLFDDYGLQGGRADAVVRVATRASLPAPAVEVRIEVEEVLAAWAELPIPARDLHGRVVVRADGRGEDAVSFDLQGATESSRSIRVSGRQRFRTVESEPQGAPLQRVPEVDVLELAAREVGLEGEDIELLCRLLPEFGEAVDAFAPTGQGDAQLSRVRLAGAEAAFATLEILPLEGTVLTPLAFPMRSTDIRGRVIVELEQDLAGPRELGAEPPVKVTTRIAPLVGRWTGEVPVGFSAVFPDGQSAGGTVACAGLRPGSAALVDGLARALGSDGEAVERELNGLTLSGALDASYSFELGQEVTDLRSRYGFYLRDNDLEQPRGLEFERLAGVLSLEGDRLESAKVRGEFNGTPVTLTELELRVEEGTPALDAVAQAEGLSLDRSFLRQFLDEGTVATLIDEFGFRGRVDISSARVKLRGASDDEFELVLSGNGRLSDFFAKIGLPLSIRSAQLDLEEFVISGGEVRGWGRLRDLYGLVLDRDFSQASMLLSYYGSRLSVDTLDGSFCHGRIYGAGAKDGQSSGPVFSVDLLEPYTFLSNVAIDDVDVGLLLEDVFSSEIADRGYASGEVRLQGRLANLLSVKGSGRAEVRDTVLWSVPVLRDLFTQLGYDATAIFDDMSTEFRVEDGLVFMEDMKVHSPLLNLSGRGTLGLDGALHHDLQVKYSLVDKAGPLGSLIHLLQDTLLSVSIRGDMARPRVFLRGALTGPFQSVDEDWRAIPLPGFSSLPERF